MADGQGPGLGGAAGALNLPVAPFRPPPTAVLCLAPLPNLGNVVLNSHSLHAPHAWLMLGAPARLSAPPSHAQC